MFLLVLVLPFLLILGVITALTGYGLFLMSAGVLLYWLDGGGNNFALLLWWFAWLILLLSPTLALARWCVVRLVQG